MCAVTYNVNAAKKRVKKSLGALIDQGAGGGIAGRDMTLVEASEQYVDLTGLQEHTV